LKCDQVEHCSEVGVSKYGRIYTIAGVFAFNFFYLCRKISYKEYSNSLNLTVITEETPHEQIGIDKRYR
jgi:hypothetical protein